MKNPNRQKWNEDQKYLRSLLAKAEDMPAIFSVFLTQHAKVHAASVTNSTDWSFADEVLTSLDEQGFRGIPPKGEHSVAWVIFHISRIEDITMNMLLCGSPQVFTEQGWAFKVETDIRHAGNEMTFGEIIQLSKQIDIKALLAYRDAVGSQTRKVVLDLQPEDLKRKVDPARLQRVRDEGALLESAEGVYTYWSGLTAAGLILMPPTRHNFYHLNECLRISAQN